MSRLKGRVVIVSGGAQGIGQSVALRAAAEGASVVIADLQENTSTADEITDSGGRSLHVQMDVRKREEWARLVETSLTTFGALDALANVAGVTNAFGPDTIVDLDEKGWDYVIDTDLRGVWLGMQAVLPHMLESGAGSIVNVASMAALKGLEDLAAYTAAKGGVLSLTRQAAMQYSGAGVRFNCICPGTIDTPILAGLTDSMREHFGNAHIMRRLGGPKEVAAAAAFFLSDDSSFCTGEILPVDGGWNAKGSVS
jgi:NAD(P)-dependent dehydrogenase (short-subunit alcohol dehydrogenase family)